METQYIPCAQGADAQGRKYARIAPTQFPLGPDGNSVVMHRVTSYNKQALWNAVKIWLEDGKPTDGAINPEGAYVPEIKAQRAWGWKIYLRNGATEDNAEIASDSFMHPVAINPTTLAFQFDRKLVAVSMVRNGSLVTLPEYYRLTKDDKDGKDKWFAVAPAEVPAATGLAKVSFSRPVEKPSPPLVTPDDPQSCWKKPGPKAGPFVARPGDGSTVTYYWYRFADQPAILNADLTASEREELQKRVENIHRYWTKDRNYLAPPTVGKLAELDPALVVKPPAGLGVGYVPIVTRQAMQSQ
jgi:hypothetical protein